MPDSKDISAFRTKPVFLAVHQLFSCRYLLGTDIFEQLRRKGVPFVILSPNADDEQFRGMFEGENVVVEKYPYEALDKVKTRRLYEFFAKVRWLTLPGKHDIRTVEIHELEERLRCKGAVLKTLFLSACILTARVLRRSEWLRTLFVKLEAKLCQTNAHAELFRKYQPSLVVTPDIGFINYTGFLMEEARRCGIAVVSVILSWDNLTSKGIGVVRPDFTVVWNENMRDELQRYHAVAPERIFVGGVAHFDDYFRDPRPITRTVFLKTFDLSEERKTIFYGTSSPSLFLYNIEFIELLLQKIRADQFCKPCQLLVRFHPAFYAKRKDALANTWQKIEALKREYGDLLAISQPLTIDQEYGAIQPIEDQRNLAAILRHSDVMVNIYSTLMLEACIFDLPVINIGFYNYRNTGMTNLIVEEFTHIKRIVETGATRTARDEAELFQLIEMYLNDKSIDRDLRLQIRENEAGPNKGRAGAAIAGHIKKLFDECGRVHETDLDTICTANIEFSIDRQLTPVGPE